MNQEKSKIYISKRCQHCRKLLLLLKDRPDIRGTVQIITIDDNPFPNIIKNVPSMIDTKGELWTAEEIFKAINESRPQQQQQPPTQQPAEPPAEDQMFDGYCEGGSCLAFAPLDDNVVPGGFDSQFANIDDQTIAIDVKNDGYQAKNEKTAQMDGAYERMMAERANIK